MVWKDIPGTNGRYQASSTGLIKSKRKVLKQMDRGSKKNNIYKVVDIDRKNQSVHRLVMAAFFGESELYVNHKDGDKFNNNLENLEYCTAKENTRHAFETGLMKPHGMKKIKCINNDKIYNSITEAGKILNIRSNHICEMLKNKRKSVGGYKFRYIF